MPKLAITVHVHDPETGRHVVFHKGAEPPDRVVALIKNPDVWEDPEAAAEAAARSESAEANESDGEPPRSGKGSGRDTWVAFAEAHGVHVDDDDTRDDIITALAEAGVIEE